MGVEQPAKRPGKTSDETVKTGHFAGHGWGKADADSGTFMG